MAAKGNGLTRAQEAARQEKRRVRALIEADRAHRSREAMREAAELEVREGVMVNLADTVVEPTPEWLAKGENETYVPSNDDNRTVRTVKTVRRTRTPIVVRLHRKGQISDDMARACLWYRWAFERAGLEGRYSSMAYEDRAAPTGPSKHAGFSGHIATSLYQAEIRRAFRGARGALTPRLVKFFDAMILDDIPISRAARFAQTRRDRALKVLREQADLLLAYCEANELDLSAVDR